MSPLNIYSRRENQLSETTNLVCNQCRQATLVAFRIFVINSPGELFFQHHLSTGELSKTQQEEVIQKGQLIFQVHLFTSDETKFRSKRYKPKLFRSKNETYSVRDQLPGELFEGGSYFSMSVPRGGGGKSRGGVIQGNTVFDQHILQFFLCSF